MSKRTKYTPTERPAEYLERVAALTGAKQDSQGKYRLTVGRRRFVVDSELVELISEGGKSTCFSVPACRDMPGSEVIASALLQLKSNPRVFKKWRKQPGYAFKANGKMFIDVYQLTLRRRHHLPARLSL